MAAVRKTYKCGIFKPTKYKEGLLEKEYNKVQEYTQLQDYEFLEITQNIKKQIYSATIQAIDKYSKPIYNKNYPMFLRNDTFKFEVSKTKHFDYWFRCPVKGKRGGILLPIKTYNIDLQNCKVKDSKVVKKKSKKNRTYFELQLTVEKEFQPINTSNILSVDLGERYMAVTVSTVDNRPKFFGKDIRGIRRKYNYIRNHLGEKKLLKKIRDIGSKEKKIVKQRLEEIASEIVSLAVASNSAICVGDLKGIRNSAKGKGRRFNRIVNNMPCYELTQMLEYKANWEGISVVKIPESYTSKTCSKCGSLNTSRPSQARFKCKDCRLDFFSADVNGCRNILNRSFSYIGNDGVFVDKPKTNQELEVTSKI